MSVGLGIVIPVYNEGANIRKTVSELTDKVKTGHELLIVYDFDEDDTVPVVKEMMQNQPNIRLVKNRYGRGALNAIKTGFEASEHPAVLVVMADMSDDLSGVDHMYGLLNRGYDLICGSRYMKGGRQIGGPRLKKFLSRMAGVSLHLFSGLPTRDVTNSFKMYSKRMLEDIEIESDGGFELGMEIVIKAYLAGYKITEVPTTWHDRSAGESRFRLWKWLPKYFHWYLYALKGSFFNKQ